ncbi:NAD(P)H-binding protein [Mycolicibacterium bacteremicum]|uniref:LysR family transcriptional regulator n=2 Tax=Mycolicibacterium bacteremicum TaxID=564198 RepID=A0A1W9YTD1_MYCBA|nr:NAD(P)H-binding protein [Mycolicibacterium bacteremicum]ORA03338.1 LysR family transcriptional regulator [Mycolicibacterium bacteremicum]
MFVLVDEEELEARKDRRVTAKNITVVGATGQIGRQLVDALTAAGHHVTGASRHSGVDAALGTGLDEALAGADVVIDVLNSPTMDDDAALAFFTATSANVSGAAKKAGVGHYVLLSIVGVDGLQGGGYLRGKVLQENTVAASGVPYTIVRATQFHEFTEMIAGALVDGDQVHAPDALIQPIATADVTAVLARVATEAPLYGVHDVGGPEKMTFAALAAAVLPQQNLRIRTDPAATYFGTPVTETSLVTGAGAELAPTRLADWLGAR